MTGYRIFESLVESAEELSFFDCTFAGTDRLPTDTIEANAVTVENASGVHGPDVAEQMLDPILTFVHRLDQGWQQE